LAAVGRGRPDSALLGEAASWGVLWSTEAADQPDSARLMEERREEGALLRFREASLGEAGGGARAPTLARGRD
jgi:hypothetical protein